MGKIKKSVAMGLPAAVFGLAGYFLTRLKMSLPRTNGHLHIPGLEGEVEVVFDRSGMPHITADRDADAFRALGYVMAQDRIIQMEAMLNVALGTLSRLVGPMALEMDRFMRAIGIGRVSGLFERNLEPESAELLNAFCGGVNSYLSQKSIRLPFEFIFLGGRPDSWRPSDTLALGLFTIWLLDAMWPADLMRERLRRTLGFDRAAELLPQTCSFNNPPVVVEGPGVEVEPVGLGEEIDWGFETEGGGAEWCAGPAAGLGSNNWVLGGSMTDTGKPILCGDPHVQHNAPGVLYMFHMKTSERNVIGATFAGLPVIAYGHNGYCGWSATSLCADTIDLYVETFESGDSDRYLYNGEWVDPEVIEEEIEVRFSRPRRVKVIITRHGPIIKRKGNKGLALKWVSHEAELDSLAAMMDQNKAGSWDEFVGAMEGFVGPGMNQVYADVDGNIGYLSAAKVPLRAKGDGSVPYDGSTGDCDWEGYVPWKDMPRALNPESGFFATANSKIVSEGYPELITTSWEAPYRNGRITQLISSRGNWSVDDMAGIHADVFTFPGRRFAQEAVAAARGRNLSPATMRALEYLENWDYQARADSVAMSIYFYGWEHLREELLRHRLGSTLYEEYKFSWTTPNLAVENILEKKDPFWLPPSYDSYESLIIASLELALSDLEGIFQTGDLSKWQWGRIHYLVCQNLLGLFWPLDRIFNVGPVPRDGEGDTVNASPPASDCLSQLLARGTMGGCSEMDILPDCKSNAAYGGPVMRMILDFSDLDNSRAVLDVGQSGHRLSPHYKDHFPHWLKVEYLPMPYSREAVLREAAGTIRLLP